jgi:hypothetical protein
MGTISIRMDAQSIALAARLARQQGKTKSEVIREALHAYGRKNGRGPKRGESLYDRVKDIVGSCDSGGLNLSVDAGRKYVQMLSEERRAKHAGRRRPIDRTRRSK